MISDRRFRDMPARHAAQELAALLASARAQLPGSARICPTCQHVFTPTFTTDRRCPGCVRAAADSEAVRL